MPLLGASGGRELFASHKMAIEGTFFVTHHQPGRSRRLHLPAYRQAPSTIILFNYSGSSIIARYLNPSPLFDDVATLGIPLIVFVAAILAFSAQSWINSLIGGEQGLGAYLSDGSGFNKSACKQRKRSSKGDEGEDPLPWLKLPEFDFVDVAGQRKNSAMIKQPMTRGQVMSAVERDQSEVLFQLDLLRAQLKMEVEMGNLEAAKDVEIRLERLMKEEGYDFSL